MGAAPILTIQKNGETIKSQPLDSEVLLGRSEGCVIRLDDRAISRQHAVFRPVPGGVQVEKKSEFAPLSVNGAECTSAMIKEGDVIAIGPYLMRLTTAESHSTVHSTAQAAVATHQASPVSFPDDLAAPSSAVPAQGATTVEGPVSESDIPLLENAAEASSSPLSLPSSLPLSLSDAANLKADSSQNSEPKPDFEAEAPGVSLAPQIEVRPDPSPNFSMDPAPLGNTGPLDLGSFSLPIDPDAKTKVLSSNGVSAKLVFPDGVANVTEFEINQDEISIGRGKDCDIVLDDKKTSRKHALFRRIGVSFSIKDLESANGVYVNGTKIHGEQELSGDDVLKIGNVEFRFLVLSSDYVANQDKFIPVPEEIPQEPLMPEQGFQEPEPSLLSPAPARRTGTLTRNGLRAIPGIAGIPAKKTTLLEKFRALPKGRQIIWLVIIIGGLYVLMFDDEPQKAPPPKKAAVSTVKGAATFESLTTEQKKYVKAQHALAFDYFKAKEFDKAIFELQGIFKLLPDYENSREIERYAQEGKKKLEALEEEKRRKEEENKLKLRIAELVDSAKGLMAQKKYDDAREIFPQILALDPDNIQVADWRKDVDRYEEEKRIQEQQKEVQEQINARAWDMYKEGLSLKKQKQYKDAIDTFRKVAEIGATDKKAERAAAAAIRDIQRIIAEIRDPILADAKQAEDAQDLPKAYQLYEQATEVDPAFPAGYAGMDRIRDILHERAKTLYIDGVLAESYTDFETAKKKYMEVKNVAPKDDIYYERASRRLATFFRNPAEDQQQ